MRRRRPLWKRAEQLSAIPVVGGALVWFAGGLGSESSVYLLNNAFQYAGAALVAFGVLVFGSGLATGIVHKRRMAAERGAARGLAPPSRR